MNGNSYDFSREPMISCHILVVPGRRMICGGTQILYISSHVHRMGRSYFISRRFTKTALHTNTYTLIQEAISLPPAEEFSCTLRLALRRGPSAPSDDRQPSGLGDVCARLTPPEKSITVMSQRNLALPLGRVAEFHILAHF